MVPDRSSLSRRRLLGGLAGLAAGGTVAVGATAPTLLPDVVTDQATNVYPTPPEMTELWRPTVTESHAREAVGLLARTVSDGERLWRRLETDDRFTGAGGWLETARETLQKGDYREALFDATYGIQFAGEQLGIARAKLGAADPQRLARRTGDLRDRLDRVAADLRPYPVAEPPRDLAWYYAIEQTVLFGRFHADWDGATAARDGVDEGDAGFDSGHALAEKHRARSVYRSVVGSTPPPLLTVLVRRAVEDLQVAKVGFAGSYRRPLWRERLEAYLYALVGRAKLRRYLDVYDAVVTVP
ncbi:MAG: hypothetical protein ABEJ23_03815 [Haloarculaceae archaeon]